MGKGSEGQDVGGEAEGGPQEDTGGFDLRAPEDVGASPQDRSREAGLGSEQVGVGTVTSDDADEWTGSNGGRPSPQSSATRRGLCAEGLQVMASLLRVTGQLAVPVVIASLVLVTLVGLGSFVTPGASHWLLACP